MKVLLYGFESSKAVATLYNGFSKLVGNRNVYLCSANDPHESNCMPRGSKYNRFVFYKIPPHQNFIPDAELRDCGMADDFDIIVFFDDVFYNKNAYWLLNRPSGATKVFFDDKDDFFVKKAYLHKELKFYFKREMQKRLDPRHLPWTALHAYGLVRGKWILHSGFDRNASRFFSTSSIPIGIAINDGRWKKLRPFPVTIPAPVKHHIESKSARVYDVSFMGNLNNYLKKRYYLYAKSLSDSGFMKGYFKGAHIDYDTYADVLRHSKVGLSLKAFGEDAYRFWETVYEGATLLSHTPLLVIPNNFVNGESALFFETREEMRAKIERYVLKSDEWYEIGRAGNRHFWKYHTPERRIKDLMLKYIV